MRKTLPILVLLGAFGILVWTIFPKATYVDVSQEEVLSSETSESSVQSLLTVDFGEGETLVFEGMDFEGESAYSILEQALEKRGIVYETEQYDFGVFVKSIKDLESNMDKSWIYFVNNESGSVAADQYELKIGDQLEWKYLKTEF